MLFILPIISLYVAGRLLWHPRLPEGHPLWAREPNAGPMFCGQHTLQTRGVEPMLF